MVRARDANALESLLESLVGSSPVEKALHLVHVVKLAKAFDMHRATITLEVQHGHLKPTRFRGGLYFSCASILEWFTDYQRRSYRRVLGGSARYHAKKARLAATAQPATIREVASEVQPQA
jgi:hypothetical protein